MRAFLIILLALFGAAGVHAKYMGTFAFFRALDSRAEDHGTRRVFGGELAELAEFPTVCLLTDSNNNVKCSGSIVAARWVLTAAHCVTPKLSHVNYNTRMPSARSGDVALLIEGYRHPHYKVIQQDEGRGMDVTDLYHDIGLLQTRKDMILDIPLHNDPLVLMRKPLKVYGKRLKIMGFGRAESSQRSIGEQLLGIYLRIMPCDRVTWINCFCGVTDPGLRTKGVCSGDSGGPVLLDGTQVGVTSMGPVECVTHSDPNPGATSVFTSVLEYVDIINDTINMRTDKLTMAPVKLGVNQAEGKLAGKNHGALIFILLLLCLLK